MIKHFHDKKDISIILRKRYLLAFAIIAFLITSTQVLVQFSIKSEKSYSRIINLAGRQRMLSQRITKDALAIYSLTEDKYIDKFKTELKSSLELFKVSHCGLVNGDEKLGLPGKNSEIIEDRFLKINESYENILNAGYNLLNITESQGYTLEDLQPELRKIMDNEYKFLDAMDKIVFQYEHESEDTVQFIQILEFSLYVITLIVLLMELLFIFKPARKEIQRAFLEIQESHLNLLKLFEASPSPLLLIDEDNLDIIEINNIAEELVGIKQIDHTDLKLINLLMDTPNSNSNIINKLKENKNLSNEEAIIHGFPSKSLVALISSRKIKFYDKGTILLGLSDITKLKKAEELLEYYATIDEMTGLLNKRSGLTLLDKLFNNTKSENSVLSLCFIDIDGLKSVNDNYGHTEGDWYIKVICKAITANIRSEDIAFRYGGDEIILIFNNLSTEYVQAILDKIHYNLNTIEKEYMKPYHISISAGVVDTCFETFNSIDELIKEADQIMYTHKKSKNKARS